LVLNYLNSFENIDVRTRQSLNEYIELISNRAKGTNSTNAIFIRQFVQNHREYQHDSIVNERIQFDLLSTIRQMNSSNQKQF